MNGKNGTLFHEFEDLVFSGRLYNNPVEFRIPTANEEIVVRTCGNVFRGGRGIVEAAFPTDDIFIVNIGGVSTMYVRDQTSQRYWKCIEVDRYAKSITAHVAVPKEGGGFILIYSP